MADRDPITIEAAPSESLVRITHIIYGLHAFSIISGIIGAATIVGMFLTGWPSIIAVIINYVKQSDVKGTYLESHFRWQIRTFWFALLWVIVSTPFIIVFLLGLVGYFIVGLWATYRIALGWLRLNSGKSMYQ
ncbi:MAG: hypothetical protein WCD07_12035 [Burkholderiales bacterium]